MQLENMLDINLLKSHIANGYISERFHTTRPNLAIYNYTNKTQFDQMWDDVTEQCRGLIVNTTDNFVVGRPFRKFHNYSADSGLSLDTQCDVYDKYDGSLIIVAWYYGEPIIATRGSFVSDQAILAKKIFKSNWTASQFTANETYLFELVGPSNKIVLDYHLDALVPIARVNRTTGQVVFSAPLMYATTLRDVLSRPPRPNSEGVVIHFNDNDSPTGERMLKIKQEDYLRLHSAKFMLSTRRILEALRSSDPIENYVNLLPDEFHSWAMNKVDDLSEVYELFRDNALDDFDKIKDIKPRGVFAQQAKATRYPNLMFALLDGKDISDQVWGLVEARLKNDNTIDDKP